MNKYKRIGNITFRLYNIIMIGNKLCYLIQNVENKDDIRWITPKGWEEYYDV